MDKRDLVWGTLLTPDDDTLNTTETDMTVFPASSSEASASDGDGDDNSDVDGRLAGAKTFREAVHRLLVPPCVQMQVVGSEAVLTLDTGHTIRFATLANAAIDNAFDTYGPEGVHYYSVVTSGAKPKRAQLELRRVADGGDTGALFRNLAREALATSSAAYRHQLEEARFALGQLLSSAAYFVRRAALRRVGRVFVACEAGRERSVFAIAACVVVARVACGQAVAFSAADWAPWFARMKIQDDLVAGMRLFFDEAATLVADTNRDGPSLLWPLDFMDMSARSCLACRSPSPAFACPAWGRRALLCDAACQRMVVQAARLGQHPLDDPNYPRDMKLAILAHLEWDDIQRLLVTKDGFDWLDADAVVELARRKGTPLVDAPLRLALAAGNVSLVKRCLAAGGIRTYEAFAALPIFKNDTMADTNTWKSVHANVFLWLADDTAEKPWPTDLAALRLGEATLAMTSKPLYERFIELLVKDRSALRDAFLILLHDSWPIRDNSYRRIHVLGYKHLPFEVGWNVWHSLRAYLWRLETILPYLNSDDVAYFNVEHATSSSSARLWDYTDDNRKEVKGMWFAVYYYPDQRDYRLQEGRLSDAYIEHNAIVEKMANLLRAKGLVNIILCPVTTLGNVVLRDK